MVDYLLENGVEGIYACGSTGEGPSLTSDERREVAEGYVTSAAGRCPGANRAATGAPSSVLGPAVGRPAL